MKKKFLIPSLLLPFFIYSCQKQSVSLPGDDTTTATENIIIPKGFEWENSRNINFTVNVTDDRFQNAVHVISIYDGDPAAGASLLSKGSATIGNAFKSKLYLSNQVTRVYVVKISLDDSKATQQIQVGISDVNISFAP